MTVLRAYRQLLRNGPLTRLLVGEFVSSIGDWLYLVAILILVYEVTEDPVVLGLVGAARVLPYLVLSIPAGIVADRFDRRMVLLSTDVARGLLMLVIAAIVFLDGPVWLVIALAIGGTCFATFFGPAIGAYLPNLVEDEDQLGPANSAWSTLDNLAFMVGPAVAGILIAAGGLVVAFLLNAASFAVIAVVLWGLPRNRPDEDGAPVDADATVPVAATPVAPAPGPAASAVPGPAVLVPVIGLALIDIVGSVAGGGLSVLTVIIATTSLGGGDAATGFLNAGIGLGGFIGALVAGALVLRPSLVPVLVGGSVLLAIGLAGLGYAASARRRDRRDRGRLDRRPRGRGHEHDDLPAGGAGRDPGPCPRGPRDDLHRGLRCRILPAAGRLRGVRDRPGPARDRHRRGGRRHHRGAARGSRGASPCRLDRGRAGQPAGRPAALRRRPGSLAGGGGGPAGARARGGGRHRDPARAISPTVST